MAKLTWLGPDDYAEGETPPRSCTWAGVTFPVGVAVEVSSPTMIAKAKGNRMFKVDEGSATTFGEWRPEVAAPVQWREPETEADPADDPPTPAIPPDYQPEDDPERGHPKRKRGRPPNVRVDNAD